MLFLFPLKQTLCPQKPPREPYICSKVRVLEQSFLTATFRVSLCIIPESSYCQLTSNYDSIFLFTTFGLGLYLLIKSSIFKSNSSLTQFRIFIIIYPFTPCGSYHYKRRLRRGIPLYR